MFPVGPKGLVQVGGVPSDGSLRRGSSVQREFTWVENRFLFDVDKATKALANSGYVMIVKNDVLEPISGNQDLPTLFTTGRIFLILYYRDVDGAGSVRLGGGGPAPGGGVPREHEFHDATLCPRHVAQNVRENNLLRPIVTRPDGLTDRDPAGGKFPRDPLFKKTTNEGSPDSGALPSRKGCC